MRSCRACPDKVIALEQVLDHEITLGMCENCNLVQFNGVVEDKVPLTDEELDIYPNLLDDLDWDFVKWAGLNDGEGATRQGLSWFAGTKAAASIEVLDYVDKPVEFALDVHSQLDHNGVWVLQVHYTPFTLKQSDTDGLVDGRASYFTLHSLKEVLKMAGLTIINATLNEYSGGGLRVVAVKDKYFQEKTPHLSPTMRLMGLMNVNSLLQAEDSWAVNTSSVWHAFSRNLTVLKQEMP